MKPLHILLAEDDEVDVLNFQRALERFGDSCSLQVARDGEQAWSLLKEGAARLAVLDINLPRRSGLELLADIRKDTRLKMLPVVILTTSLIPDDRNEAHRHLVAGYFQKSAEYNEFQELVHGILRYWLKNEFPD